MTLDALRFKFFKYPETPGINGNTFFIISWLQISGKIYGDTIYNFLYELVNDFLIGLENLRRRLNFGISTSTELDQTDSYMRNFFLLDIFFSLGG